MTSRVPMKLFNFFNSSASYRVRIALSLKGLAYEYEGVNIRAGVQYNDDFLALNPAGQVPVLVDGPTRLSQSLAIIDHLDRVHPEPLLIPADGPARGRVLEMAQLIACDIHPLNNLIALQYLRRTLKHEQAEIDAWYHHWVLQGFETLEATVQPGPQSGPYAFGNEVTLADICLVPQMYNARRLKVPLDRFPKLVAVDAACQKLPAFDRARPENQPDAE